MMQCEICSGEADARFGRVEVWRDKLWRLTMHTARELGGFCYLEPLRHIAYVTDLDGEEAATFGPVLAHVSAALKRATGAKLIYVYVYGGTIPHLHVHLAPHRDGDDLYCDAIVHRDVAEERWTDADVRRFRASFI
jgi:diadenosine tetraphosphate (Ap4A) HIT family hydrolase